METGLLLVRLVLGLSLAAHGAQKLFGAFGGYGIAGTGGFFESLGFRPGKAMALLAGLSEFGGGLAIALGFATPLAAAAIIATMIVATWSVHLPKGFFAQNGGYELNLLIAAVAASLAFTGPGALSLDAVLQVPSFGNTGGAVALILGILGAVPPLVARAANLRRSANAGAATTAASQA